MFLRAHLTVCLLLLANLLISQSVGVGGAIFVDNDDNGIQNVGELTVGEIGKTIQLNLVSEDGILVATTTSDSDGYYLFETEPGNYFIQFMPPYSLAISSSVSNTKDDDIDGDDNGSQVDTDGDSVTDGPITSGLITLSVGDEPTNEPNDGCFGSSDEDYNGTIDFGLTALLGIGGSVFIDQNDNGILDSAEDLLGYRGVQVQMNLFNTSGFLMQSTTTDSEGRYEFETKTGDYYISFEPPLNYPSSSTITSTSDNNISLDDNGIQEDINGDGLTEGLITSAIISLRTGDEPINEPLYSCTNHTNDENADMTIDFGLQETTISSVSELIKTEIKILPNPVVDFLTLSSEHKINSLEIRTSNGQLIRTVNVPQAKKEIRLDVGRLVSGSYVIIINTDLGRSLEKFMKL